MEGPQRKAAVDAIATARAFGDLSENFEYHAAKNEQGLLEARITKLRHKLQHAVTVEHTSTDTVGVGSIVEIEDEQGEKMEIEISSVGGVSPDSPLGSALMGASVGDGRRRAGSSRLLARHRRLDPRLLSSPARSASARSGLSRRAARRGRRRCRRGRRPARSADPRMRPTARASRRSRRPRPRRGSRRLPPPSRSGTRARGAGPRAAASPGRSAPISSTVSHISRIAGRERRLEVIRRLGRRPQPARRAARRSGTRPPCRR